MKPQLNVRIGPKVAVKVPKVKPRRVVRVGAAAVVYRGTKVVRHVTPSVVVAPAVPVVVPAREYTEAEAYRVVSVDEDYTLMLMIDGEQTPVRLLGVEPLLVAVAEDQAGAVPQEAYQFVRDLVVGERVYLDDDLQVAGTDAEGIRVAYVYRVPDKLLVNLEIIRQGYGLAAEEYSFEHQDVFTAYENRAQGLGKGIWGGLTSATAAN